MKPLLPCLILIVCGASAQAASRCSCILNGARVEEGQTACIRPGSGEPFLARCVKVLNNTSWQKLQDGCPSAKAASGRSLRVGNG